MLNKTPMQELFEKFGHLLPNVEDEYVEKERELIKKASKGFYDYMNYDVDWNKVRFMSPKMDGSHNIHNDNIIKKCLEDYYNQNYKNE